MNQERLQKVLARAGIASRRHAEQLIVAGHVRVNGRVVTEMGLRVDPHHDKVEVDGRRIVMESPVYAIVHKPRGVVTTLNDPEGRPTIAEYVKSLGKRVFPIGRLDFHTSGALLVTNDGALAQALLHPRHHVAKVYVAKVRGTPTDGQLDAWRNGVVLPPTESDPDERAVRTAPADVHVLRLAPPGEDSSTGAGATWIQVTLREGRTRQIHRMADATGLFVMRLVRLSFADVTTEGLRPGDVRALTDKEVTSLRVRYLRPLEQGTLGEPTPDDFEEPEGEGVPATKRSARRGAPAPAERPVRREAPAERPLRGAAPAPTEARPKREAAGRRFETPPKREGGERHFASAPQRDAAPKREGAERRYDSAPKREGGERRYDSAPKREGAPRRDAAPKREGGERRYDSAPKREGAPRRDAAPKREGGERRYDGAPKRDAAPKREGAPAPRAPRDAAPRREGAPAPRAPRDAAPRREGAPAPRAPRDAARGAGRPSAAPRRERADEKPRGKFRGRS